MYNMFYSVLSIIGWILPEIIMFISSISLYFLIKKVALGHLGTLRANTSIEAPDTNELMNITERSALIANLGNCYYYKAMKQ